MTDHTNDKRVILLVEDSQDDAELVQRALKRGKLLNEIVLVRDGVEALAYLFAESTFADRPAERRPALVLLDLKLPRVDGLEVLRRMRSDDRTRRIPVVVLTSSTEEEDIVSSYDLGANSYVRKPVDFREFTGAVTQLGLYWMLINVGPEGS